MINLKKIFVDEWDYDPDDPPYAPCGCQLIRGPDSYHKFNCFQNLKGLIIHVTSIHEVTVKM